ncbi:S-adenosyl-L-methionine-dependent methyltransferase [Lasiosphaeria ovina]|uniref:S-adenosyl-L-methionine-dependent methyltransferase n=1 Tax=Lasiosphaeria ovina TaxID=92902 RepID=A0AAE0NE71_9PEZI|nr:S-adenosyl-L-methionine-dependent methyltransferase [Lasiosphaeria ovina]
MADLAAQIESAAKSPPSDPAERLALYNAAQKLFYAVEDPLDSINRVNGSPLILIVSFIAANLNIYEQLAAASGPLTGASLAASSKCDPVLMSRILRVLASNTLILETDEDTFAANNITQALARPGYRAGIIHSFKAVTPSFMAMPDFLAETNYENPKDLVNSPFQKANNTDKPAFVFAMENPDMMANFNVWMAAVHGNAQTWLHVFDFAGHVKGSTPETAIFVDIAGGLGQQSGLIKKVHPEIPGRVILEEQPFILPQTLPIEGIEKLGFDLWAPQPIKGAKVYYARNILHDYPDDKAIAIIQNTLPALTEGSILIIDEIIIPNTGVHPTATQTDMIMLASFSSIERTERQWDALLDKAGLKIVKKAKYNTTTGQSAIITVPK